MSCAKLNRWNYGRTERLKPGSFQILKLLLCAKHCCNCIQAFYFYFIKGKVNCTSSCVCEWDEASDLAKSRHLRFVWTCPHQELPQRMLTRFHSYWNSTVNLSVIGWFLVFYLIPLYHKIKNIKNEILTRLPASCHFSFNCFSD